RARGHGVAEARRGCARSTRRTTSASDETTSCTKTTTAAAKTTTATRSASADGVKLTSSSRFAVRERSSDSWTARKTRAADASRKSPATAESSADLTGRNDRRVDDARLVGPHTRATASASPVPTSAATDSVATNGAYHPKYRCSPSWGTSDAYATACAARAHIVIAAALRNTPPAREPIRATDVPSSTAA